MDNFSLERQEATEYLLDDCFDDSACIEGIVFKRVAQMSNNDLEGHMTNHYGADSSSMLDGWDSIVDFVRSDMLDSAQSDEAYLKSVIQDYVNSMSEEEVLAVLPQRSPNP